MSIAQNLKTVKEKIEAAKEKRSFPGERSPVTLIAVSKTKPVSMLQEAYDAGVREFGENRVQELCEKMDLLPGDIHWHLIGHLQKNKVKYIVDRVSMIHSVDSLDLAAEIQKQAEKKKVLVKILIEVNMGGEESKFGCRPEETLDLIRSISGFSNLRICGLMTVAPPCDDPEEIRPIFRKMRELAVDIDRQNIDNTTMNVLSMGMTGDYTVAVEEGATMVRVGTGIFGERNYSI